MSKDKELTESEINAMESILAELKAELEYKKKAKLKSVETKSIEPKKAILYSIGNRSYESKTSVELSENNKEEIDYKGLKRYGNRSRELINSKISEHDRILNSAVDLFYRDVMRNK